MLQCDRIPQLAGGSCMAQVPALGCTHTLGSGSPPEVPAQIQPSRAMAPHMSTAPTGDRTPILCGNLWGPTGHTEMGRASGWVSPAQSYGRRQ